MGILLFIVFAGLLQSCFVVCENSVNCTGFRLFNGDIEITNFTCVLYGTTSCQNGPTSFPGNLSQGQSVGKPRNFDIIPFHRNFTIPGQGTGRLPGAKFTWEPPVESISRQFLKGFYLKQLLVGSSTVICRLIDLQNVDLTASPNFHFSYEIHPYEGSKTKTYLVYLTSLPPPLDEEYEGLVESKIFSNPPAIMYGQTPVVYPSKWLTWISVKLYKSLGIVEMTFGLPDANSLASFTKYKVQIVVEGQSSALRSVTIPGPDSQTVGRYNFTNIPSGTYRVQVQPWDVYFNQDGQCQCWDNYEGQGQVCSTCRVSSTGNFIFETDSDIPHITTTPPAIIPPPQSSVITTADTGHDTVNTEQSTVNTEQSTFNTGHSTQSDGGSQSQVHVIVAVVVAVVIVSGIAVTLFVLQRKGKLTKWCRRDPKDHNKTTGDYKIDNNIEGRHHEVYIVPFDQPVKAKEAKAPQLRIKKVVVLAAQDHEFFTGAVERLGRFLERHCMCEVTFAPQQMAQLRKAPNSYLWLSRQIDSADYVVMVTSEAAFRLYQAYQDGKSYTQASLGPEGDLFTPGLQHVCGKIASRENVQHVLRVCLDHTPPSTYRLPLEPLHQFYYQLPNNLAAFLHHIHDLDKATMDLSQVNLPLQGNIEEFEEGREWLAAVQQAEKYERDNPQWFELKFGKPTASQIRPDYSNQVSKVSDDSGIWGMRNSRELERRLSSASNTARGLNEGNDVYEDIIKDCFSPPSLITANTAYTIPYPDEDVPSEMDNQSITDEFHKVNICYEQKQSLQESEHFDFVPPSYEPQAFPHGVAFVGLDQDDECISVTSGQSV